MRAVAWRGSRHLPLLGSVPGAENGDGNKDDNGFPAVSDLDLKNPGVSILLLPSAHRLFANFIFTASQNRNEYHIVVEFRRIG